MADPNNTAGGLLDDSDSFLDPKENTAGGLASSESTTSDWERNGRDRLNQLSRLGKQIMEVGTLAYGTNAAQRWGGTSAVGLSMFKPRIIGVDPPHGLSGGMAMKPMQLTSEPEWAAKFGEKGANGVRLPGGNGGGMSNADWKERFGGGLYSWDPAYPHTQPKHTPPKGQYAY